MKKFWIIAVLLFAVGCTTTNPAQKDNQTDKPQVIASFYPMEDFVKRIGKDHIEVTTLIDAGTDPHGWEMTTKDRERIEKADIFVYNGSGFEHWAEDLLASVENKELIAVEASKGVELMDGHGHEHHGEAGHEEHMDSHTWISLRNAVKQLETIKEALIKADPANESDYQKNYEESKKAFEALDQKAVEAFSDVKRQDFIVGHESFGYFAADYGLTQHGIEGASSIGEPDPKQMAELTALAAEKGIRTVFYDPLGTDKIAKAIAAEIQGEVAELNPLEGRTTEEITNESDYLNIMEKNITALKKALTE